MASEAAQKEVERQLHDIGARLGSPPDSTDELLKLVEEAETWLSRVEQSPPDTMFTALRPTMSALIKKELLGNTDADMKVAVASCLTEVTRITAPEAPYDDDVMKDVFARVVETFSKLDDMGSESFARRVTMLETVAKVRSCVLMLDLDCDDLILQMFRHFFRTISSSHPENVISSMETIMKFVIEESEDVHPELASCLLQNVKKEEKETLPASFGLAEKVIGLCHEKLKSVFLQLLQGTPLDEYSKVVTSLCQDGSDAGEGNNTDASGKDTADDSKLSERTVSNELPQESSKLEQDVSGPGQDGTPPNSTPTTVMSNGGAPVDNVKSPIGPASSERKPERPSNDEQAKVSDHLISDDREIPEPIATEPEKPSDLNSKKYHKFDSSTESEITEHSKVVNDSEALVASGELSPETKDDDKKQPSDTSNKAADGISEPVDSTPAAVKPKRGRPPVRKSQEEEAVGKSQGSGLESKNVELVSDFGGRATRRLAKHDVKSSSRKAGEEDSSKKQQKASLKLQKEEASEEHTDEDLCLKEMVSPKSSTKMSGKTKGQLGEGGGSKRKHVQETEEVPQPKKSKVLDGSLVGARIKVWWPDDEMFYDGVVESFDDASKRHEIVYDDGDVEVLLLSDEKWKFIAEEQDNNPDVGSDTPRGRRGKGNLRPQVTGGRTETPKSKQHSSNGRDLPKKGRPKAVRSSNSTSKDDSARSKGKSAEKDAEETPKTGKNLKKDGGRWSRYTGKTKDDLLKASNKDDSSNSGRRIKDSSNKSANKSRDEASNRKVTGGSKTNGLSTKRKPKEKEDESSEKEKQGSARTSTGKKRRRKIHS